MKVDYETNFFNNSQYTVIRQKIIDCGKNNPCKEPYYKMIARDILGLEGFQPIIDGPSVSQFRGVPFDFVAKRSEKNCLIELKGSLKGWSRPGDTQLTRMHDLLNRLTEETLEVELWLLQISLEKGQYRLWNQIGLTHLLELTDVRKGKNSPMVPIVDWIKMTLVKI